MDIKQLAKDRIKDMYVMQLATSHDDKPWICNVHFWADDDLNLYWMSVPNCRHSEEIATNGRAAAAFAVHVEAPVVGVQIEGDAEQLFFADHQAVLRKYAKRHDHGELVEDALSGKAGFRLYRLTPHLVQVFDLQHFPDAPKQQWRA